MRVWCDAAQIELNFWWHCFHLFLCNLFFSVSIRTNRIYWWATLQSSVLVHTLSVHRSQYISSRIFLNQSDCTLVKVLIWYETWCKCKSSHCALTLHTHILQYKMTNLPSEYFALPFCFLSFSLVLRFSFIELCFMFMYFICHVRFVVAALINFILLLLIFMTCLAFCFI